MQSLGTGAKAVSAEVMLAVYKLYESQESFPLHIRDITYSAHICNKLQCSKTDILYSWCVTTVCNREMSVRKCVKEPVKLGRDGIVLGGHLSGGVCPDTPTTMYTYTL